MMASFRGSELGERVRAGGGEGKIGRWRGGPILWQHTRRLTGCKERKRGAVARVRADCRQLDTQARRLPDASETDRKKEPAT